MTDHALLLVNLGSPASTEVADVRRYLNQFLMDPYVIDLPWPVRRLLVSLILWKRPAASALEHPGHLVGGNALSQPFGQRGLAHARLPHKAGVVLLTAA